MDIAAHVAKFLKASCTNQETLVVAVSGGMDSMCLLHTLWQLREEKEIANPIAAVHVHHGLREEADDDANLVASFCRDRDIPYTVERIVIEQTHGMGVEAKAREARYRVLVNHAQSIGKSVVVLAHHQSDQVETFLLRYLRGSGLHGLASMKEKAVRDGILLLRPLLQVPKQEIQHYVERHSVVYAEDASNADIRFSRNYLRHEVIPRLAPLQSNIGQITARLTEALQVDDDYLTEQAMDLYRKIGTVQEDGTHVVNCQLLLQAHLSLQRRLIHILLNCFTSEGWTFHHIDAALQLAGSDNTPSASIQLANGLFVWRSYERLYIGNQRPLENTSSEQWLWRLDEANRLDIERNGVRWHFRRIPLPASIAQPKVGSSLWRLYLPETDVLNVRIGEVKSRRVRPLGMSGSKKIQDVFTDRKVPRHLRGVWPVFAVCDEVVWVPGLVRGAAHKLEIPHQSGGWIVLAHLNHVIRDEIGTLYRETRRMIME